MTSGYRTRLGALVRAKLSRGTDHAKADKIRSAIKRATDAYTWGGMDEGDDRAQLSSLRDELGRLERVPDERRILAAIRLAQDLPRAWAAARSAKRRELAWPVFERITMRAGRIVSVKPREETAPLLALRVHTCGPDRGWERGCELGGVAVEGVEDLLHLASAIA